jgi:hypothetical protein
MRKLLWFILLTIVLESGGELVSKDIPSTNCQMIGETLNCS